MNYIVYNIKRHIYVHVMELWITLSKVGSPKLYDLYDKKLFTSEKLLINHINTLLHYF